MGSEATRRRAGLIIGLPALLGLLLGGCQSAPTPEATAPGAAVATIPAQPTAGPTTEPTAAPMFTGAPIAAAASATGTPSPEPAETSAATPTPSATPHPLAAYTIAGMRERNFPGGEIRVRGLLEQDDAITRYYIDYPSDGLTITGLMYAPAGDGPFPTLILLHGYIEREQYYAGADTWQAADYFARRGYLVLAPDLRGWGESDSGLSLFHTGLTADVLNLISSLPSLPEADPARVGLWGHSMGGGIAAKVLTVDDRVRAALLYAPNSADDADLIARWGPGCLAGQSQAAGDHCNPGEIIPPETPPELIAAYLSAASDPDFLRRVAPLYYLNEIAVPIQIHIGEEDGLSLVETPVEWSARLAEALRAADRDVTVFSYPGQGHAFLGQGWETLLERALAFFDQTLRPDG